MLVFGDLRKMEQPPAALETLAAQWPLATKCERASLYIDAARIAQGCVDREFQARGQDGLTPLHCAALNMLRALGQDLRGAQNTHGAQALRNFVHHAGAIPTETRIAEGFAFYALHPHACLAARGEADVVIGLRSIGMALAPLLALSLGAKIVMTLRPVGHPFARSYAIDAPLQILLKSLQRSRFAIIDEGPGLSGSSLGAIADALEALGAPRGNIAFYASHTGDLGPCASQPHRERWAQASKHALAQHSPRIVQRTPTAVRDLGAGAWRAQGPWPDAPSNEGYERAKFLLQRRDQSYLAKFIGLGAIGAHKARLARTLSDSGFTPKLVAARQGYLVERWISARRIHEAPRAQVIAHLARYLAFRARLPAPDIVATPLRDLLAMARYNTRSLSEKVSARIALFEAQTDALGEAERRVATDNRMQAWEWLLCANGSILKADAIDHHAGHDLIGPRDIAWDAAGAIVEFNFDADEQARFTAHMEAEETPVRQPLLDFFLPVYCAFQFGAAVMAAQACPAHEAKIWRREQARYGALLTRGFK